MQILFLPIIYILPLYIYFTTYVIKNKSVLVNRPLEILHETFFVQNCKTDVQFYPEILCITMLNAFLDSYF